MAVVVAEMAASDRKIHMPHSIILSSSKTYFNQSFSQTIIITCHLSL